MLALMQSLADVSRVSDKKQTLLSTSAILKTNVFSAFICWRCAALLMRLLTYSVISQSALKAKRTSAGAARGHSLRRHISLRSLLLVLCSFASARRPRPPRARHLETIRSLRLEFSDRSRRWEGGRANTAGRVLCGDSAHQHLHPRHHQLAIGSSSAFKDSLWE